MALKKYFFIFSIIFFLLLNIAFIFSIDLSSDLEGGLSIDLEVTNPVSEETINNSLDLIDTPEINSPSLKRDPPSNNFNSDYRVIQKDPLPKNKSEIISFSRITLLNNNFKIHEVKATLLFYDNFLVLLLLINTFLLFILMFSVLFIYKNV